jgi:hypothetical protein
MGNPSKRTSLAVMAPRESIRVMALAVIDLPEPDSPTRPTASPSPTSKDRWKKPLNAFAVTFEGRILNTSN